MNHWRDMNTPAWQWKQRMPTWSSVMHGFPHASQAPGGVIST
ncbi:MAG: hypothetical protein ACTHJP_02265 [Rhodanobacteraceae bacterium]